jgi:hypothetical protein
MEELFNYIATHPIRTFTVGSGATLVAAYIHYQIQEAKENRQLHQGYATGYDVATNTDSINYLDSEYPSTSEGLQDLKEDLEEENNSSVFDKGLLSGVQDTIKDQE